MSLDGLRAWIGEVERKLGVRTRVFLVLLAIAIGASGAAIYLALQADDGGGTNGGASTEEVQSLREQVELEGGGAEVSALEAQIVELRSELGALQAGEEAAGSGGTGTGGDESADAGGTGTGAIPEKEAKKIPESEAE